MRDYSIFDLNEFLNLNFPGNHFEITPIQALWDDNLHTKNNILYFCNILNATQVRLFDAVDFTSFHQFYPGSTQWFGHLLYPVLFRDLNNLYPAVAVSTIIGYQIKFIRPVY